MLLKELIPIIEDDQLIVLYHNKKPINKGFPYRRYDETYQNREIKYISSSTANCINIHIK